jgi:hypothetical protein
MDDGIKLTSVWCAPCAHGEQQREPFLRSVLLGLCIKIICTLRAVVMYYMLP